MMILTIHHIINTNGMISIEEGTEAEIKFTPINSKKSFIVEFYTDEKRKDAFRAILHGLEFQWPVVDLRSYERGGN